MSRKVELCGKCIAKLCDKCKAKLNKNGNGKKDNIWTDEEVMQKLQATPD